MAQERFGRKYSLIIGRKDKLITRNLSFSPVPTQAARLATAGIGGGLLLASAAPSYTDFLAAPPPEAKGIEITDLQIDCTIKSSKSSGSTNSTNTISIYNLSKSSQEQIDREDSVLLRAGYEQDLSSNADQELPLIVAGQILSVGTTKKGQDIITKITLSDSYVPKKNLRVSKSYPRDTTYLEIITDLMKIAADFGVPFGGIPEQSVTLVVQRTLLEKIPSGKPVEGFLFEELEKICNDIGFTSYTSLGKLYVDPIDGPKSVTQIEINSSDIKGTIRPDKDSSSSLTASPTNKPGIKFTTLLDGRITDKVIIQMNVPDYTGVYDVTSLQHKMNFERGAWQTDITCARRG